MDMSTMTQSSMGSIIMSSSASAPGATSSPASGMGEMDMGGGMGPHSCKISMLWNWYTVDSCFLARSWHVRSSGAFAGSCIGVILLVISLELLRRAQREYDLHLHRSSAAAALTSGEAMATNEPGSGGSSQSGMIKGSQLKVAGVSIPSLRGAQHTSGTGRLTLVQQVIRSFLYMLQFAVGYFIMLLAMYYNGYIIICIFIGAFLGAMIFQWDTFNTQSGPVQKDSCCS